jgi:hypothetical protein
VAAIREIDETSAWPEVAAYLVDFIVQTEHRSQLLAQFCESLAEPRTMKPEVKAQQEAMAASLAGYSNA